MTICDCECGCNKQATQDERYCHPCLFSDHRIEWNEKVDNSLKFKIMNLFRNDKEFRDQVTNEVFEQIKILYEGKMIQDHPEMKADNLELSEIIFNNPMLKQTMNFKNKFGLEISGSPFSHMTQESININFKDYAIAVEDIFPVLNALNENGYDLRFNDVIKGSNYSENISKFYWMVHKK